VGKLKVCSGTQNLEEMYTDYENLWFLIAYLCSPSEHRDLHNVWLSAQSEGEVQADNFLTHPDGRERAFCKSDGNSTL